MEISGCQKRNKTGWKRRRHVKQLGFPGWLFLILLFSCKSGGPGNEDDPKDPVTFDNAIRLTDKVCDVMPRWSLFGRKIAFERNGNVYTYDLQSGGLSYEAEGHTPFWSPESDRLGFVKNGEIYIVRLVSSRPVIKLTLGAYASDRSGCDWNAADQIVYFQEGSDSKGRKLMVYHLSTDTYQWIETGDLGLAELPRWAPTGRYILFASPLRGICLYDLFIDELNQLTLYGAPGKPCWFFPLILFVEGGQLFNMDINGANRTLIYDENFYIDSMDHSFDKEQIIFGYNGIWVMDFPPETEE